MQLAGIGLQDIWVPLVVIFLLFYANRIPELFRNAGEGMKEFKKASRELTGEEKPPVPARTEETPAASEARESTRGEGSP